MSRKTTRSYAGFLRAYGNDFPQLGFTLGEQLQPVVIVDDQSSISRPPPSPEVLTRLYRAALAGSFSLCVLTAGAGGARVLRLSQETTGGRVVLRNDSDGINANRVAVLPPVGIDSTAVMTSSLTYGTNTVSPLQAGREFIQLTANELVDDLVVPPSHSLILYGLAANTLSSWWIHYREGVDA